MIRCACGAKFDDVEWMVVYPHWSVKPPVRSWWDQHVNVGQ